MLAAAALALLLQRGDAAAAPRSAARAAALSSAPLVDLCPPFLAASSAGAAARLAAGGARLPLRKRLHPPRPEDGDVARVAATWRGCEALPAEARAEEEAPAEPQLAAPWDSFGGGAGGGAAVLGPAPIEYNGGAILTGDAEPANATPVHLIWYGAWNASDVAVRLLPLAVAGASNSPWMRINAAYWSLPNDTDAAAAAAPARRYASPALRLAQQVFVSSYSYGAALGDDDVAAVVADAIDAGLPLSSAAVYVVLTSADVALTSGFCKDYCGWHASGTLAAGDTTVRFAFVGDPAGCARVSACTPLSAATAPNALGADAMASVLLHELAEAVTDPDLDAWYDRDGLENADKCAWRFGTAAADAQGRLHNVELSGQRFMIQQNWVLRPAPAGGYCAMEPAI